MATTGSMNTETHAVDVDARNFNQEVLEASKSVPVIIDFWAPWCGPCKVLKPMLEKLAIEYGGKFRLVRINSDESIDLAREFNVRSIPDVRAIRNSKQVGSFVGALPLPQLRGNTSSGALRTGASRTRKSRQRSRQHTRMLCTRTRTFASTS